MSTAKRVIKNTGFLYAKMGITMFISLYTTRLILNTLGAVDFGIFNIVGGAIAMLGFLSTSMASTTQRFMSYYKGEGNQVNQNRIFNISIILHGCLSIIAGIFLILIGAFLFNKILNIPTNRLYAAHIVYYSMVMSTVLTIMTVPYDAVLNAHENMLYYAIVGIIESLLKLIVAYVVINSLNDKLVIYGISTVCITISILTIMYIYCRRKYTECSFKPKKYFDKKLMKEMMAFAGWDFLTATTSILGQYGMGVVLNHFFGPILNAAQGIANQIAGQLMAFSNTMLKAINPVITKSEGDGNSLLAIQYAYIGSKCSFLLLSIFAIPFLIETPFILSIWLRNIPEWGIIFCRLQVLRALIEQLTVSLRSYIYAKGEINYYSKLKSILYILPLFIAIILFYEHLPPYIIYILWIVFWGILGGITVVYFATKGDKRSYKQYLSYVFYPSIFTFAITISISKITSNFITEGYIRLFSVITISILVNIISIWIIGITKSEKQIVYNYIAERKFFATMHK